MAKVSGGYRTSSTDDCWIRNHHHEDNHRNHHSHHNRSRYSMNDVGRIGSLVLSDHFFLQVFCGTDNYVCDWCTCVFGGDGCLSNVATVEEVHFIHCIGGVGGYSEISRKTYAPQTANDIALPFCPPSPEMYSVILRNTTHILGKVPPSPSSQSWSQLPMHSEK